MCDLNETITFKKIIKVIQIWSGDMFEVLNM